jgi:hypothetical protein
VKEFCLFTNFPLNKHQKIKIFVKMTRYLHAWCFSLCSVTCVKQTNEHSIRHNTTPKGYHSAHRKIAVIVESEKNRVEKEVETMST